MAGPGRTAADDLTAPDALSPDLAPATADGPDAAAPAAVDPALLLQLQDKPWTFDFFQAVRRLEAQSPEKPRVGRAMRPADDAVVLGQLPSLAFAPSTIAACRPGRAGPPRLYVNFLGMLGPNGPLPLHLTEYARDRARHHHDPTFARFLDVFNHRMLSLFYRAWASTRQSVSFDRAGENLSEADRFGLYISSLVGLGAPSLRGRDSIRDVSKLHYSGRFICQTRHPEGLAAIIADYFQAPATIEEFAGRWMRLPDDCTLRLGESRATGALGSTAIVGERIWECQGKFRLRVGPMSLGGYEQLLPGSPGLKRLVDWVRLYAGDALEWDLRLVLRKNEAPRAQLGGGQRLGWTTWMRSGDETHDRDELVLRPQVA